ncbi:hypothetical protein FE633_36860 [Streptomyces montanus]|uniref:Lipoprotein n=1 Tax=Streptomyces montanus TaxID=2580423 RepID=A0A5R9FC65_9ACTN|nr:hypothetical protein [Streptomyces montanus]TLS41312.1 hypothetical protein FE633_36860 [Streptomyces montanus]
MAGRGRAPRWIAGLLLAGLVGCGGAGGVGADTTSADVRHLLDRRAQAVLDRDAGAYVATEVPSAVAAGERAAARTEFTRLRTVPLAAWSYRVTGFHRSGDRATVAADLRYRIDGYDRAPVVTARTLSLIRTDGRWYVASDRPAEDAGEQLWEQGTVRVARGEHSLVLGVGQSDEALSGYAHLADRAVPAVREAWGGDWSGRVVVLVPQSLEEMAGLLGAAASGYRGIAAVTTGEVGGAPKAPADRIIVNPDAYGVLGSFGRQVVLTHETTHVATRARTSAATPLWLSEGYADWVGYRGTGRSAAEAAPELRRAVGEGQVPAGLPDDADFGFGGDAVKLARAYESGWLACRLIADRWGEVRLGEFYRAVGAHRTREGAVEGAMRDVLGTTPRNFTEQWQAYLRAQLG